MDDEWEKYTILENLLQKINKEYIALPPDECKRNNAVLSQVIGRFIQKLRNKDLLFANLYQRIYYGGSFYDGLRVGMPSEYDLDCLLCLPKIAEPMVEVSNKCGYVHIVLNNLDALKKQESEAAKYPGLEKNLLEGNRMDAKKVKRWMESLVSSVLKTCTNMEITIRENDKCSVNLTIKKSGPAFTILLEGCYKEKTFKLDVDLVPCFIFFDNQWPKAGYRENPLKNINTFFVVPKTPSETETEYWRLSFQEQERALIRGCTVIKPTIRLIKKIRDRYNQKIASYYIKTVFLWELEKMDENWLKKPLSFVLITMLKKYCDYIDNKCIPYYWNKNNNLIENLSKDTTSCIANKVRKIADQIDKICINKVGVYDVLTFFLKSEEYDLETFKQQVPLSKKHLKQLEATKSEEFSSNDVSFFSCDSESSTLCFEAVSKDLLPTTSATSKSTSDEVAQLAIAVDRMAVLMESLETQLEKLTKEMEKRKLVEEEERKKVINMVESIDQKLDRLLQKLNEDSRDEILNVVLDTGDI